MPPSLLFATGRNNMYSLHVTKPPYPSVTQTHSFPLPIAFLLPSSLSPNQFQPPSLRGPLSPRTSDCFPAWGHRKPLISLSRQLKTTSGRLSAERLWLYCRGLHKFLLLFLPILTPASETGRADIISTYILEIRNWRLRDRVLGCDCTVEIQVRLLSSGVLLCLLPCTISILIHLGSLTLVNLPVHSDTFQDGFLFKHLY